MPQFKNGEKIYILMGCSLLPLFYMVYASEKPKAHTPHIQDSYLILTRNSGCTSVHRRPKLWLLGYEGSLVSNCIMILKNMDNSCSWPNLLSHCAGENHSLITCLDHGKNYSCDIQTDYIIYSFLF